MRPSYNFAATRTPRPSLRNGEADTAVCTLLHWCKTGIWPRLHLLCHSLDLLRLDLLHLDLLHLDLLHFDLPRLDLRRTNLWCLDLLHLNSLQYIYVWRFGVRKKI